MKPKKSTQNATLKKYKEWALDSRFRFLVGAAAVGIFFALSWYLIAYFALAIDTNNRLSASLTMLLLSLPILCLLWFFRTHDTKEQIQKTQANINTSMLHKAIDLALANGTDNKNQVEIDPVKRGVGLKMLAQLRRTNSEFETRIDFVTKGLDLRKVDLFDADLRGIDLQGANLQEADLQEADLRGADLQGADLQGADLQEANLRGADLQETDLRGADLQRAHLQGADLRGAHLQATDLPEADLHLPEAHLRGAQLQAAHLREVHLQAAQLQGTNLQEADLQGAKLQGAHYNSMTSFTLGFNPQDEGMIKD